MGLVSADPVPITIVSRFVSSLVTDNSHMFRQQTKGGSTKTNARLYRNPGIGKTAILAAPGWSAELKLLERRIDRLRTGGLCSRETSGSSIKAFLGDLFGPRDLRREG